MLKGDAKTEPLLVKGDVIIGVLTELGLLQHFDVQKLTELLQSSSS